MCACAHTNRASCQGAVSQTPLSSTLQLFESWLKTCWNTGRTQSLAARFEVGQCVCFKPQLAGTCKKELPRSDLCVSVTTVCGCQGKEQAAKGLKSSAGLTVCVCVCSSNPCPLLKPLGTLQHSVTSPAGSTQSA